MYLTALSILKSPLDARAFGGGLLVLSSTVFPNPVSSSPGFAPSVPEKLFLWFMVNGPRRTGMPPPDLMKRSNIPPAPTVTFHVTAF